MYINIMCIYIYTVSITPSYIYIDITLFNNSSFILSERSFINSLHLIFHTPKKQLTFFLLSFSFRNTQKENVKKKTVMELRISGGLFAVVLVGLLFFQVGFCSEMLSDRNHISWDDLKVDEKKMQGLGTKSDNVYRVIVVDKNGNGHSRTVQGAIDMVPQHNTKRVKIYILPGIYRYIV